MAAALDMMNEEYAYAVLAEEQRRLAMYQGLVDPTFPAQAQFVLDNSPRKAALCTRRAGKSYGIAADFIHDSESFPGSAYTYMTLTRKTAKDIMWDDVLKPLNSKLDLGARFNEAELSMRLPNGARIDLVGADSEKQELDKKLGGKKRKVVIDEAGSFKQDVEKLAIEILEPAVSDLEGQVTLIGTPTDLLGSYFHKVTSGEVDHGWSIHKWNTFQNPHMVRQWGKMVNKLKATYGDVLEELPWYQRMYLGKWVTDLDSLCYKFNPRTNVVDALPEGSYTYVLGIDLGFDDPTAFVLGAYNSHQKVFYIVESHKKSGMIISDVASRLEYYQNKYNIHDIVIDNASKQAVEELKQRFSMDLEPAEKQGKAEYIEMMNSDFKTQRCMVLDSVATQEIRDEWGSLIWDETKKPKRIEHSRCENHCSDAGLYAWRKGLGYLSEPPMKEPTTDQERVEQWEREEEERMEREKNMQWWERDQWAV